MNQPPRDHQRVSYDALRAFVKQAGLAVGMADDKAELLAAVLATNELRGVWSHGTQQMAAYAPGRRRRRADSKEPTRAPWSSLFASTSSWIPPSFDAAWTNTPGRSGE